MLLLTSYHAWEVWPCINSWLTHRLLESLTFHSSWFVKYRHHQDIFRWFGFSTWESSEDSFPEFLAKRGKKGFQRVVTCMIGIVESAMQWYKDVVTSQQYFCSTVLSTVNGLLSDFHRLHMWKGWWSDFHSLLYIFKSWSFFQQWTRVLVEYGAEKSVCANQFHAFMPESYWLYLFHEELKDCNSTTWFRF